MKLLLPLVFVVFSITLQAQSVNNTIVIGTIDSIQSKILNEKRKLWVYVPNSGTNDFYSKQKYPVIYLLDGDSHFYSVMSLVQRLSETMICPEMIIIGIPNTNRFRDLTPTKPKPGDSFPMPPFVGGGEKFTSFLEKELIPYVDSTYPTAPYRMMIGHSLGGLMVINTLLHHTHLFNSYLSLDPSLWWDNELMVQQADSLFQKKKFNGKSLYLAMANNNLPNGTNMTAVMNDTSENAANPRPMLLFGDLLEKKKPQGLQWKFQYYPDDNHGSVTTIAQYDALRFLFSKYTIPVSLVYKMGEPTFNADSALIAHFKGASEQLGYTILPPENFVNENAYAMMQSGDMDRAFRLFDLNVRNYPDSYNVYDSMGDYYMAKQDKANAILFFTKALALKENPLTKQKLEEVKAMK